MNRDIRLMLIPKHLENLFTKRIDIVTAAPFLEDTKMCLCWMFMGSVGDLCKVVKVAGHYTYPDTQE